MSIKYRLAIITADFHHDLAVKMVKYAKEEATSAGVEVVNDVRVAGSYEVPLVADALLRRGDVDAAIALGFIEKGKTLHGEVMGHVVFRALVELQLKHKKPIGMGIIGPGATAKQAKVRAEPAARGAVNAVLRSHISLQSLKPNKKRP